MVVAIDWCSHTTNDWIWLVGCFGFNGPLKDSISVYIGPSAKEGERKDRREKKTSKLPPAQ